MARTASGRVSRTQRGAKHMKTSGVRTKKFIARPGKLVRRKGGK
jgi:hypothetical protein